MRQLTEQTHPLPVTPLRVLMVGDEAKSAEPLGPLLELRGYKVANVRDAFEMLDVSRRLLPDVILLDVGLPGMNGFEAAALLRQERQLDQTLLVALTGWGTDAHKRASIATGFDAYLAKPVAPETLLELLARLASHKRSGAPPRPGPCRGPIVRVSFKGRGNPNSAPSGEGLLP